MHSQSITLDEKDREQFEKLALADGHKDFSRRGKMYCVTDLNFMAQGFNLAMKSLRSQLASL